MEAPDKSRHIAVPSERFPKIAEDCGTSETGLRNLTDILG